MSAAPASDATRSPVPAGRSRPAAAAAEGLALGLCVGLGHAAAEITLAGWYGARLGWADVALVCATCAALGGLLGIALAASAALAARGFRSLPRRRWRALAFALITGAYALAMTEQLMDRAAGTLLGALAAAFALVVLAAAALLHRRWDSLAQVVAGLLAVVFAAVAAPAVALAWSEVSDSARRAAAIAGLLAPALLLLLGLAAARRRPAPRPSAGGGSPRAALRLALAVLAAAALLSLAVWPPPVDWQVSEREPAEAGASDSPASAPAGAPRPNVLLVVLDTVRAQSLDLFGYARETMPRLTRFARTEADHAAAITSTAAATLPAHASMFTGHYSYSHGAHKASVVDEHPPAYAYAMRSDLPTLAELLARAGYRTGGISANFGVFSAYGLTRGFEYFDVQLSDANKLRNISWLAGFTLRGTSLADLVERHLLPEWLSERTIAFNHWLPDYRQAECIERLAVEWIRARRDRPFFLFVNFLDAHAPYLPPPAQRYRFVERDPRIGWVGFPNRAFDALIERGEPVPPRDVEYARGLYDAELAYLDEQIDRLLGDLRTLGAYDDTLIVIVSDHGESFMEDGVMKHSSTVFDTQISVPLVIRFPRGAAVPEIAPTFQHVDLLPSVLSLLSLSPPDGVQGSAWGTGRDHALAEVYVHYQGHPVFDRELAAVRMDGFKLVRSTQGEEQLFDLRSDPGEKRNLLGTQPALEARMRAVADERERGASTQLRRENEDEALLERLRALGYVE